MLPKLSFAALFRRKDVTNSVKDRPGPVQGLDRINGAIARVGEGAVFGPAVLQLPELPRADRRRRCRWVLDGQLLVLGFSHM